LQAVLEAPKTDYLFFAARPDFSGYSNFSSTFKEHLTNANEYRKSLHEQISIRDSLQKKKKH